MLRTMYVLEGLGAQEPKSIFTKAFDHPYFGQIFLAAYQSLYGYPTSPSLSNVNTANHLPNNNLTNNDNTVTLVGSHWLLGFSWILTYISDNDKGFKEFYTEPKAKTGKVLLLVDKDLTRFLSSEMVKLNIDQAQAIYDNTKRVAEFKDEPNYYQSKNYPYNTMDIVKRQTLLTQLKSEQIIKWPSHQS